MIIIDNGHGCDTAGKRSPDGQIQEWSHTRRMGSLLKAKLEAMGVAAMLLVPEDRDVPLHERAARANAISGGRLLVSLHINAAGDGSEWKHARGWSAHIAPEGGAESRRAATLLAGCAAEAGLRVRRPSPDMAYWEQPLAICRLARCPAVLTENLFMDNADDCALLRDSAFIDKIISAHVQAIARFLNN